MENPETKAKLTDGPDAFGPAWKAETMRYSKLELVELYKLALLLLLPVRQDLDDAMEALKTLVAKAEQTGCVGTYWDAAKAVITKVEGRSN